MLSNKLKFTLFKHLGLQCSSLKFITSSKPVLFKIPSKAFITSLLKSSKFTQSVAKMAFQYPEARRDETVSEQYHGQTVNDPYRWLEDPDAEETVNFVDKQNAVTRPYLEGCPQRSEINARLTELWDFPKYSCPYHVGNRYYLYQNTGLQNQSVMYLQDTLTEEPRVFFDPNTLSSDGTIALSSYAFSEDGNTLAYGLSKSGSDWLTIQFKDVNAGTDYSEVLEKVKFSPICWTHDHEGIFYGQYPDQEGKIDGSETVANEGHKLYYHRLGTSQSEDVLVVQFPEEPRFRIGADVTDCGRYLLVMPMRDCRDNLLYFTDLSLLPPGKQLTGLLDLTPIVTKLEADYQYITNDGPCCIFRTNKDAPNYRLIKIDLNDPAEDKWTVLIPEHEKDVLDWASSVDGDKLVVCYIKDVVSKLQLNDLRTGNLLKVFDVGTGAISTFSGHKKHSDFFFKFVSFLSPGTIFQCDLKGQLIPTIHKEITVSNFDASNYETKQVFYNSKDGTRVPMFIVHGKDIVLDGSNPCLLYGYGGFNITLQPTFSVMRLVFIQHFRGIVAIPNIRGGGEYGEAWHNAGRLLNKQNVFDDFQAAAEYLQDLGYTTKSKLTIQGGSNGGLLVAACINQRSDLFGAAIAQVGVLDMLRYHKFTIGYAWTSDYGSSDDPKHFANLMTYSPLHNVRVPTSGSQYPATLLLTADHDDRVVPLHSLKFIATLQHTLRNHANQKNPLIIRVDTKAGHGGGKPTTKLIDDCVDMLCFIVEALKIKFYP